MAKKTKLRLPDGSYIIEPLRMFDRSNWLADDINALLKIPLTLAETNDLSGAFNKVPPRPKHWSEMRLISENMKAVGNALGGHAMKQNRRKRKPTKYLRRSLWLLVNGGSLWTGEKAPKIIF